MKTQLIHIAVFVVLLASKSVAQLSPGDLAKSHAHLEGMSNCTQCHTLGEKVSNDKCLACHKEIKTRLDAKKGYHYSKDVRGKDCATCHSDHHGRNFDMVRFDEKNFNHQLTGYELTGAHKKIDCRECHKPDYVDNAELKKRRETFLGLGRQCLDCHQDYHQKTLANDCAKCHLTDAWEPASKFNHDKTDFPLVGKHKPLECKDCHQTETRNGKEFQRFAGVPFKNCNSCHDDPHQNKLGANCKECHNEQSFASTASLSKFNHAKTNFPLKGKHKQVDCAQCHRMDSATPANIFQDRLGVKTQDCANCHRDVHEGKFGTDCAGCHNETSFQKVAAGNLEDFNHAATGFALEGKHAAVDCRKCHVSESFTDPLPHNTCAACHSDYHEGQFSANAQPPPDCAACHVTDGFAGSTFSIEQHAKTRFPLDGAHVATPCIACHLPSATVGRILNPADVGAGVATGKWQFRNIGARCVDCHDDVHRGSLPEKWYPNQACESCHLTETWVGTSKFDHSLTAFQLTGAHARQQCGACHAADQAHPHGKFSGLPTTCAGCHEDPHGGQFQVAGATDCARCHGYEAWTMSDFDHAKTRFPLEGKHAEVACEKCHLERNENGERMVVYRLEKFECVDCHK